MKFVQAKYYKSPLGELIIGSYNDQLVLCDWRYRKMRDIIDKRIQQQLGVEYRSKDSSIIEQCIQQLNQYFKEERTHFDLPVKMVGSDFQQQVWSALMKIKYGETTSYLQLSRQLGNEKAIRAVATANGANAISIIIPCHRVIGSNNELVGYAGGLEAKKKLLRIEKCPLFSNQLEIFDT